MNGDEWLKHFTFAFWTWHHNVDPLVTSGCSRWPVCHISLAVSHSEISISSPPPPSWPFLFLWQRVDLSTWRLFEKQKYICQSGYRRIETIYLQQSCKVSWRTKPCPWRVAYNHDVNDIGFTPTQWHTDSMTYQSSTSRTTLCSMYLIFIAKSLAGIGSM